MNKFRAVPGLFVKFDMTNVAAGPEYLTLEQKIDALTDIATVIHGDLQEVVVACGRVSRPNLKKEESCFVYLCPKGGAVGIHYRGATLDEAFQVCLRTELKDAGRLMSKLPEKSASRLRDALALFGI